MGPVMRWNINHMIIVTKSHYHIIVNCLNRKLFVVEFQNIKYRINKTISPRGRNHLNIEYNHN